MAGGYSNNTIHRYNKMWRKFSSFATEFDPNWRLPVPVTMLACYGVWLSDQGYKPATINAHLAGVGWWHKIKGLADPSKDFLVRRFQAGLVKVGPPAKQSAPVRFELLSKLLLVLPSVRPRFEVTLFKSVFLLAYFASLRISEYAASSSSNHTLHIGDVGFLQENGEEGLVLVFMTYKASQKPAKLFVPSGPSPDKCPVQALRNYLLIRPDGDGPLFLQESGKPLTTYLVNKTLRACVAAVGLPPENFSAHAFRAGRTTDLVDMDLNDAAIRESGRWKSTAYLKYVRFDLFHLPKGAPEGVQAASAIPRSLPPSF